MTNNIIHPQPAITIPQSPSMPSISSHTTANGTPLFRIEQKSPVDVVRLSLVFTAGTTTQQIPFSASTTMAMLNEGCAEMSSEQIAERLDFLGSYFDVGIDRDFATITICSLSKFFPQTLELFAKMILTPTFPEEKLSILKATRKQQLAVQRKKAAHIAREHFAAALFGYDHPYGKFSDHNLYDNLSREHLVDFFNRQYTGDNCFAIIGGSFSQSDTEAVEAMLNSLPTTKNKTITLNPIGDPTPTPQTHIHFDGVQSALRVGRTLFPRTHADFVPMQVLSTLLGGYFGSRLISNLRVKHGYTYGVFSTMVNLQQAGYLAIATEVGAEFTEQALNEIFNEMELLCREPVSQQELTMVKRVMMGELLRITDGPFGVIDIAIENIQNGWQQDYIDNFCRQIRDITPEQLQSLAQKYLQADQMISVVVGPK